MDRGGVIIKETVQGSRAVQYHLRKKPEYRFITVKADNTAQIPEQNNHARRQQGNVAPILFYFFHHL